MEFHSYFGDPLATTEYALCVYDTTAATPVLVDRIALPASPGNPWADKSPKGWLFKRILGVVEGITKSLLKPGDPGKSSAQIQGKGDFTTLPGPVSGTEYFDLDPTLTVNLVNNEGVCWTTEFSAADAKKNEPDLFKAKRKTP